MKRISGSARVFNAALTPFAVGRRNPGRVWNRLVNQALDRTGGSLEGSEEFVEHSRFLFECFAESDLSGLGWLSVTSEARGRLENRFRIQRIHAEHPHIADEPIEEPVFVTGLPRTATTLTHHILAGSEGHRGPMLWELHKTDLETDEATRAKRVKAVEQSSAGLARFSPIYDLIHPLRADKPEECVYILPHGLHQLARVTMPGYRRWLDEHDFLPDYRYLKQALQVLQHGRPKQRWVLKTPEHLFHLDTLAEVFPGAKVVWTHRDPVTVMGSVCSLVETTSMLHVKKVDNYAIGQMWLDILPSAVERARSARPRLPADMVIDVPYHAVASDPWEQVPKLYTKIGATWSEADAGRLDRVMERPIRDRRHEYALARYGLDHGDVQTAFGDYMHLVSGLTW